MRKSFIIPLVIVLVLILAVVVYFAGPFKNLGASVREASPSRTSISKSGLASEPSSASVATPPSSEPAQIVADVCPNISGWQFAVPAGYQIVNGQCVLYIDVCSNIIGPQATVPAGYQLVGGVCLPFVTQPPVNVIKPKTPSNSSVCSISGSSYMTGGHNRTVGFPEFWSFNASNTAWSNIASPAPFGDKSHHASVVFQNKLWVLGGTSTNIPPQPGSAPYTASNEVWSFDGTTWTRFDHDLSTAGIQNAPWDARYDLSVAVFQNKLWIMGGNSHGSGKPTAGNLFRDMWSFDGTAWTKIDGDPAVPGVQQDMPWSDFGSGTLIPSTYVSQGYLYSNNILKFTGRSSFGIGQINNKLWLFGGAQITPNSGLSGLYASVDTNNVWSFDGTTWTQFDNDTSIPGIQDAPWSPRRDFVTLSYQNKIWIIGENDVWSFDGTTWTSHGNAPWPSRDQFAGMVANGKIYIMGGDSWAILLNDVWSFDGTTWTKIDNNLSSAGVQDAPWAPRDGLAIVSCS